MRQFLLLTAALLGTSGVAHAVVIGGTTSITTADPQGAVNVTNNLQTFSFSLNVGEAKTFNALTVTPSPGNGTRSYSFSITDKFTFTSPDSGLFSDTGTGSFQVGGNTVRSGSVTWADGSAGTNVSLAGGYVVNVDLGNVDFTGDSARGTSPETVSATFKLVSGPVSVAEPASLALLGFGVTALAIVRRRSNQL